MRRYVEDVEALASSRFFQGGKQTLTLSFSMGEPLQTKLDYPGEEAVRAVVGLFRQLYKHNEPTSYNQILKLLGRHVDERDSSHRDVAVAELKRLRDWEKEVLRRTRPTMQLIYDEEELTSEVLIDLFLHGRYLHKGNEKSDKLDAWPLATRGPAQFLRRDDRPIPGLLGRSQRCQGVLKVPALLNAT